MSAAAPLPVARALDAYLRDPARAARAFDWAAYNCCHFVAGWVLAATGTDPMAGLPGTPDKRAAYRLIRRLGGSLSGAWSARLGRPAIQPELAQVGDIVLVWVRQDDASAVGLCTGRHAAMLTRDAGIALLPMSHATHAWRLHADGADR